MPDMPIKLRYSTIDGYGESRTFQTIQGARKYARAKIGTIYDLSETFGYAVDMHGIGKLTVKSGARIADLFPEAEPPAPLPRRAYDPEHFSRSDEDEAAAMREPDYGVSATLPPPGHCPRHPGVQIAYGPFDALCNRCEYESDLAAERDEAASEAAIAALPDAAGAEAFGAPPTEPVEDDEDIPF